MSSAVIVSAVRTPVGKFQGSLSSFSATQLGAIAVREAIQRANVDPAEVDECILGCVLSAGLGQNPARQAALNAGMAHVSSALTINQVCGSGLRAVALAAQSILTGEARIVAAGGMESMSNAPYLLPHARKGLRMGDSSVIDSMVRDGLWCSCNDFHMGQTAELIAGKHSITREEQDAFALESHRRASHAWSSGRFAAEVIPIDLPPAKKGASPTTLLRDESIREDASLESLAALRPAFKKEAGTVTAGNAPGVNDAAAALLLMSADRARELRLTPLAAVTAHAISGVDPKWMGLAPVTGIEKLLAKTGWRKEDVDLYEINEAFAVQALGVLRELDLPLDRVNVNGGAVAIGHPIGASGARILVTLLHALQQRNAHRGIAALCLGGGNSVALAVERS
jgi:acetyl-CoA C-acetyltransferase